MKKSNTYKLVMTSIMAAFVMLSTFLGVMIPIGGTNTMFHLGNVACLLSGILLGPLYGGLAAGIGSLAFDLLSPVYITSAPFTFIFKFTMVFVCGVISHGNNRNGENQVYNTIGTISGSFIYIILRAIKSLIIKICFLKMESTTAIILTLTDVAMSIIKTLFVVIAVFVLVPIIQEKLRKRKLS